MRDFSRLLDPNSLPYPPPTPPLPPQAEHLLPGEIGGGDGVSLSLRTAAVAHASIAQNGSSLSVAPLPAIRDAQWRGGVADGSEQWHTVELIYTDGVSVLLDGRPLFASVPLASRLLPRRSWRVAVSAKCGDRHDAHWVSSIDLERGAAVRFGDAAVRLSADGSHFASDAATFRYYRPPIVSSMTPSCGPRAGGTHVTIRGDGLAAGAGPFLCGWGACGWCDASPPASPSLSNCRCENVTHATWDAAAREMRCLTPELRGDGPPILPSAAPLSISLNGGADYSGAGLAFVRYEPLVGAGFALMQLRPRSAPSVGGAIVRLRPPRPLDGGCEYRCRFGNLTSVAASLAQSAAGMQTLSCAVPQLALPMDARTNASLDLELAITLNGQQYLAVNAPTERFRFYAPPVVSEITPSVGPLGGNTLVRISGGFPAAFEDAEPPTCRFAADADGGAGALSVPATRAAGSSDLFCTVPAAVTTVAAVATTALASGSVEGAQGGAGEATAVGMGAAITVSFNGQTYGSPSSGARWRWLPDPLVQHASLTPTMGPIGGGTRVRLDVDERDEPLLASASALACRFGTFSVGASLIADGYREDARGVARRRLAVRCHAAPTQAAIGHLSFAVSLNGQQFVAVEQPFGYYAAAHIGAPSPLFGPTSGGKSPARFAHLPTPHLAHIPPDSLAI